MMSASTRQILLIEDEPEIAELVAFHLEHIASKIEHASDGAIGVSMALQQNWDMVLLDLNLQGCDGVDICRIVRKAKPQLPIVMLTARNSEPDRIVGFESGADDYITKPFSTRELVVRINAMFRRVQATQNMDQSQTTLVIGSLVLDTVTREVHVDSVAVKLTAKEFDLLFQFMNAPNKVFKRTELLQLVWGQSYEGYLHTVNTHINRLRQKIEPNPKQPQYIVTEWGVGYKLCA